ncbi:C4-dicarboxylate transport transcriptional regulatory protein DctD [Fundidesulfovibrio magnetotacticus]|uniref:histidine kinase n=1 Tax=Fundidesulfovibrio magnetotacticus TaxID=2730080 RepID=A0A6V8LKZ0_9BACT|nr:response regulator [Fundidesulfovibrio magnetotacticus]GFK92354.1 C4-dicarboxylate transport transcriptional regulatory protein DctD [Fundidesulfovibrio magnetotacticus]
MSEKVMLVDDEDAIREILGLSIADLGYEVHTAANGPEALEALDVFRPAIVLTDIKMPGMDGIELLGRIKAHNPDIEVIMISGHGDMDLVVQSLQREALDFITKPIRDELLISALKRAAEKISMRRQLREHTQNLERIVKEKSAKLVELERQLAVGQVVEGLSSAMRCLAETCDEGMGYFNELPCFISIHNRYLEVVAVNQLYGERLGMMVGKNSWEVYSGRHGSGNACPVAKTIEEGKGQRSRETLLDAQGNDVPVIVHTAPILNKDGMVELVIEMSVDVTEVERLQEELRHAREKFMRLFDAVPCTIEVVDREHNIVEANRRFRQDFGETRGGKCFELFKHREDPCQECPITLTFEDGQSHQWETAVTTRDGQQRIVLIQTAPVHGETGEIEQVMEISTDITQIRQLQDHLTSLGLMLGSMSHGVKGLLTSLDGGVYKVDAGLRRDDPERLRQGWAIVKDKIGRIRKMVLDILYYAKSRESEFQTVDLAAFAGDLAAIIEPKASQKGVGFLLEAAPGLGEADLDETAMSAALVNFLENAVDACTEDDAKPHHEVVLAVSAQEGKIRFEIRDDGMGMDQETREKMFSLFFSSKGSRGTGLGLFISNQVVERHGGTIAVDSEFGRGTSIVVTIPRRQDG